MTLPHECYTSPSMHSHPSFTSPVLDAAGCTKPSCMLVLPLLLWLILIGSNGSSERKSQNPRQNPGRALFDDLTTGSEFGGYGVCLPGLASYRASETCDACDACRVWGAWGEAHVGPWVSLEEKHSVLGAPERGHAPQHQIHIPRQDRAGLGDRPVKCTLPLPAGA